MLLAMRASFVFDTGAYIGYGTGTALIATMLASAPYRIPNLDLEGMLVYTNKHCSVLPKRSVGEPAYRAVVDEASLVLGGSLRVAALKRASKSVRTAPCRSLAVIPKLAQVRLRGHFR